MTLSNAETSPTGGAPTATPKITCAAANFLAQASRPMVSIDPAVTIDGAAAMVERIDNETTVITRLTVGTRVRWHAMPKGTMFGRVRATEDGDIPEWLYVREELSGRDWALNPRVDAIAILSPR
jgi:hypothetical protein